MTLVVENGTGLSNAESYISEDDASTYFTNYGPQTAWTTASSATREAALRTATMYLDAEYSWRGEKRTQSQALQWPRVDAYDDSDFLHPIDVIPQALKFATAEAALRHLSEGLLADIDQEGIVKRDRVKVGPLETEIEYEAGASQRASYPKIDSLLRQYAESSGRIERG